MKLVNLTPHVINLNDGRSYPSAGVARVGSKYGTGDNPEPHDIPLYVVEYFNDITGLPEPVPGTLYIVSALLASACGNRRDLVSPASGHPDAVRVSGQVASVPGFMGAGHVWMSYSDIASEFDLSEVECKLLSVRTLPDHSEQSRLEAMSDGLSKLRPNYRTIHVLSVRGLAEQAEWLISVDE